MERRGSGVFIEFGQHAVEVSSYGCSQLLGSELFLLIKRSEVLQSESALSRENYQWLVGGREQALPVSLREACEHEVLELVVIETLGVSPKDVEP